MAANQNKNVSVSLGKQPHVLSISVEKTLTGLVSDDPSRLTVGSLAINRSSII